MKTTIELPDDLYIEVKKRAAEERTTVRVIFERAVRREIAGEPAKKVKKKPKIKWVTVDGGGPPDLDISNREAMIDWIMNDRNRY